MGWVWVCCGWVERKGGDMYSVVLCAVLCCVECCTLPISDMWSHNYVSQSNEIFSGWIDPHPWVTNPPSANIYGLAPTYGCCTVNHIQARQSGVLSPSPRQQPGWPSSPRDSAAPPPLLPLCSAAAAATYTCHPLSSGLLQGWPKFVQAAVGFALSPAPAAVVSLWAPVSATLPAEARCRRHDGSTIQSASSFSRLVGWCVF